MHLQHAERLQSKVHFCQGLEPLSGQLAGKGAIALQYFDPDSELKWKALELFHHFIMSRSATVSRKPG
jgi:hypothetical protein